MNIDIDNQSYLESEKFWRNSNAKGSNALLALLEQHHGTGIVHVIEPEPDDEPSISALIPEGHRLTIDPSITHVATPKERFWFSIESDDYQPAEQPKVQAIKVAAAKYFNVGTTEIDSDRRMARVVYPRQIVMFLARAYTTRSLPEIGRRLGGRDHTTVLHGINKIQHLMKSDWLIAYDVAHVERML